MRRLARWTLNTVTVLSLVLCVAAVVIWVRAHWACDSISVRTQGRLGVLAASPRQFVVGSCHLSETVGSALPPGPLHYEIQRPDQQAATLDDDVRTAGYRLGFGGLYFMKGIEGLASAWAVTVPWWLLVAVLAAHPVVAALRWFRRRRRPRTGVCVTCTYDLTGNVSGVCPECGTAVVEGNARSGSAAGCSTP